MYLHKTIAILAGCALLSSLLTSCANLDRWLEKPDRPLIMDHVGTTQNPARTPDNRNDDAETWSNLDGQKPKPDTKVIVGSGVFTAQPISPGENPSNATTGDVTFNFVDTDVREVARSLLGNTLKMSYVVDPRVQGAITAQISQAIPVNRVLPTLETILGMYGFSIVNNAGVYTILPTPDAAKSAILPRLTASSGDGFGIGIVPLRHASVTEMVKLLEPMAPAGAILRADQARNLLIIAGTQQQRETLLQVVNTFDVDWMAGMSFALVPLTSSDSRSVVEDLEKIFGDDATGPFAGLVKFTAIERMNAILIMTSRPTYLSQARQWIERLDASTETREKRLFVYYMQNGRASEVASVLSQIFGLGRLRGGQSTYGALAPGMVPGEIQSRGLRSGLGSSRASPRTAGGMSDTRSSFSRNEAASPFSAPRRSLGLAGADPRQPVVPNIGQELDGINAPFSSGTLPDDVAGISGLGQTTDIRIIPDLANNSLVILSTPAEYRQILAAIRKLDIPPLQILIEATIAEVTLNDDLRYGVQTFFETGNNAFTRTNAATGAVNPQFPGFSYVFSTGNIRVVLDALRSITNVKVISSPKLMVLNNRVAELSVGNQVPVATQSAVSVIAPDAPRVNTIEFRDTGVVLQVVPRVNAGGLITLDIDQEVSDAVPTTTSNLDSPTIQQRRISSSVAVQSGQTVALGGLIKDQQTRSNSGVPGLSDIPILSFFFSSKNFEDRRTELLILITPRVIRDGEDTRFIMEELKRKIQIFEPQPAM